ncbi:RpiB/LacA/LacB family sugar-phosphate isomerase [Alteromonas pelagimontana]|uniref:RpiB/LacA/LacB family sugar-phosphate isomerase n=1 Tax=Alteromonas pelagimontana TaxID=1858656 RepID=A0A6M4MHI8_9ALTE|nr:RpiB/LacA/LacB family sugar-phosphate isomerase [Alteromonas pelagimontana]QJR81646.1 RpiB/LacA/LacB family sugar-phosphate isomerase [Alteromonas pelagimontana]
MKIALMNEFSQAGKNAVIAEQLESVAKNYKHTVYNVGMKDDHDHRLTYIHLGIMASILLNSKAVDFVVTGCGTGQGSLMSLNAHPGVVCGYCIDPSDAYLFAQINAGNALSLPFAKGFGWGAELNIKYIFEKAFTGEKGQGYPPERKASQVENAGILNKVKADISKGFMESLKSLDKELLVTAVSGKHFQKCLFENSEDKELTDFIRSVTA